MRVLLVGCVLAGCGRFGFDDSRIEVGSGRPGDAAPDTAMVGPCAVNQAVPDLVTIAGETFVYTGFNNQTGPVPDATVKAYDLAGTELSGTSSDASGHYALSVPTGGIAQRVIIKYMPAGYWETHMISDRPLDRDVTGPNMIRWQYGDGPVWGDGQMGSVYSTVGAAPDAGKGTINIAVRTCDDEMLEGVTFELEPPPALFTYIDANGLPSMGTTATVGPYTSAIAFNAEPVPTTLRAFAAGRTFLELVFGVQPGTNVTYPVIHPVP